MTPAVSVVVVSYETRDDLAACLASLAAQHSWERTAALTGAALVEAARA